MTVAYIASGTTTYPIPGAIILVECMAAGSAALNANSTPGIGSPGGAGGYSSNNNATFRTLTGTRNCLVGAGGTTNGAVGGNCAFNATTLAAAVTAGLTAAVGAQGGQAPNGGTGAAGAGGAAASGVGTTTFSGGSGGTWASGGEGCPGGGGAAGPNGAGKNGGAANSADTGGAGGGGNGGGSATAGSTGSGTTGGTGGTGEGGTTGGAGGTTTNGGTAGTNGAGGGGAGGTAAGTSTATTGGAGGPGIDWDASHGGGGGAGGGSDAAAASVGGAGGLYGGGGGAVGNGSATGFGTGANGIIRVSYTAASAVIWLPTAGETERLVIRPIRPPDEAAAWFLPRPAAVWLPRNEAAERPQPVLFPQEPAPFFARPVASATPISGMAWYVPSDDGKPARVVDRYAFAWMAQPPASTPSTVSGMAWWRPADDVPPISRLRPPDEPGAFFRSPASVAITWLPVAGEDLEHLFPVRRPPDELPTYFRAAATFPSTWLPQWESGEHVVPFKYEDRIAAFVLKPPPPPVGISGISWWQPIEVHLPPPPPQLDYAPAWDPQFVVQIIPPPPTGSTAVFTVSGAGVSLTFVEFFYDVVFTDAPITKRTN